MCQSICNSSVQYTVFTLTYADINNKASKYYLMGTVQCQKYLVERFSKDNNVKECNISMITLVQTEEWATENNFTIVGIMPLDCKGVSKKKK